MKKVWACLGLLLLCACGNRNDDENAYKDDVQQNDQEVEDQAEKVYCLH
jgi:hypothetical protein